MSIKKYKIKEEYRHLVNPEYSTDTYKWDEIAECFTNGLIVLNLTSDAFELIEERYKVEIKRCKLLDNNEKECYNKAIFISGKEWEGDEKQLARFIEKALNGVFTDIELISKKARKNFIVSFLVSLKDKNIRFSESGNFVAIDDDFIKTMSELYDNYLLTLPEYWCANWGG